ncbi:MAG: dicarboxylate/amino acid:cation symporter [Clostridiales bacterium]|nr:dicarboxylate/amino acid:cation symporter [Clostridiales bacterium]
MKKIGLLPRLIIAIILGIVVGLYAPEFIVKIAATFNGIFGNFLNFVIPLIIIGFVVPGIADLGGSAGKTLALTTAVAYISTIIAGSLAYFVDSAIFPSFLKSGTALMDFANPEHALLPGYFQVEMPAIMGVMSALILAFVMGIGIAAVKGETLKQGFVEFQDIISKLITVIIIPLLPIHVFGIFANMAHAGTVFQILAVFIKVFAVIIVLHFCILLFQYVVAGTAAKKNPFTLLRNMIPAYMTAVGTQSSAATIPVTLAQTKKNGVSDKIADFAIPLCATIHLSGSTITLTSCSLAVMMLSGMDHGLGIMFPYILMLGVTMVAAPGVPGGAVMAAMGLMVSMLGFDETLTSLMVALYLAQDSFGTACNVTGDGAIAILVDTITGNGKK